MIKNHRVYINKTIKFDITEVKKQQDDKGDFAFFEGHASTFGNVDLDNDVILRGAFQNTINSGRKIALLWSHQSSENIGQFLSLHEDEKGLFVNGRINLGVQRGREAFALLKAGDIHSMSIGFNFFDVDAIFEDGVRKIKDLDLFEISLVSIPANPLAEVDLESVKSITPFQNLPVADRDVEWNQEEALKRVKIFTQSEDTPSINYRNAFLWFDSKASEDFDSYKLLYTDVINDTLMVIPKAKFGIAILLQNNKTDIPQEHQQIIKKNLGRYYQKMELVAPWSRDNGQYLLLENINVSKRLKDLEKILKEQNFNSIESKAFIAKIKKFSNQSEDVGKTEREANHERLKELVSTTQETINFLKMEK